MSDEMVSITVDGTEMPARKGELLIAAAEEHGVYIPRFCWHPRLRSVAMCRMCLVEVEGMRGLQPACYVPVADGMVVHTETPGVKKAQEGVLEFLLINHPLDCPVCDRGGECPLQDHTLAFGPGESRFVENKRHFEKPIPVSDLVLLDRERCIQCSRCTRVADEVAGDPLLEFAMRGNKLQIATFPDEPFSSYFSGNTVQVCPVGALTAAPYRFKARPWDVTAAETTCTGCSVGCRGTLFETRNEAIRLLGVDTESVSHGWLCDKGRFGYEFLGNDERLTTPLVRSGDGLVETTWAQAVETVAARVREAVDAGSRIGVIGGARGTNEEAYVLSKFARLVCRSNDIDCQLDDGLPARFVAGVRNRATIADVDTAAAVVLACGDLKEELPVLYLRVRRAATELGRRIVVAGGMQSGLSGPASEVLASPADLDPASLPEDGDVVVIVGRQTLTQDADALATWALSLQETLGDRVKLLPVVRRANAHGAIDMGCAPDLLPGRIRVDDPDARAAVANVWNGEFPVEPGRDTRGMLEAAADGELDVLFLVGADPLADFPEPSLVQRALERCPFVVVADCFSGAWADRADVIVPAAAWGEVDGTVTNVEGRVQRVAAKVVAPGQSASDAALFREIAERLGVEFGCGTPQATLAEIAAAAPAYTGIRASSFRGEAGRDGVVAAEGTVDPTPEDAGTLTPDVPNGAFSLLVSRTLYDEGTLVAHCPSLAPLRPGPVVRLNPADVEGLDVADGDRLTLRGTGGEPVLVRELELDGRVPLGAAWVPHAQAGAFDVVVGAAVTIEKDA